MKSKVLIKGDDKKIPREIFECSICGEKWIGKFRETYALGYGAIKISYCNTCDEARCKQVKNDVNDHQHYFIVAFLVFTILAGISLIFYFYTSKV